MDVAAQCFRPGQGFVVRPIDDDTSLLVDDASCSAASVDDRAVLLGEPGHLQGELPGVFMQVELSALGAGACGLLRLVDGGGDAAQVQDPGERESAEAGADDRDRGRG